MSPDQHLELMIAPRLHLDLICNGSGNRGHAQSVAGVFNIAMALAHRSKNNQMVELINVAQDILMEGIGGHESPVIPEEDALILKNIFNSVDHYIGIANRVSLFNAVEFVEKAIASGEGANIIRFPGME